MADPIKVGQTLPYKVTWLNAAGQPVVPALTSVWDTVDHSKLTAASTGLETGNATGVAPVVTVDLTARDPGSGVVATRPLDVFGPIVAGTVLPTGVSLIVGQRQTYTVAWRDAAGQAIIPTVPATWDTGNHAFGTASSTGLQTGSVLAVGAGSTTVTALDPTTGSTASVGFSVTAAVNNPAGAQFLTSSITSVSSLDTGRIGYVVAWGGVEFGYAYTYTLDGNEPAGLTIDVDTGVLTAGSPISAGAHIFGVIATNRESPSNFNTLSFTLTVVTGVTSGRTGTQVLHKTYDPHSGTYGTPTGTNWTTVLLAIQTAIKADQVTNGNERLRATIPFHKATTYNYTNNHWLDGLQYYDVTATGAGANPILQNNGPGTDYEGGPLNIGAGGAMQHTVGIKGVCALVNSVTAGATSVTCVTHAQASRMVPGRWHAMIGSCIQQGGYPPSTMFMDYFIVLSVNTTTGVVTFDRPLKYGYQSDWWENIGDDQSFGRAWIVPWDTGGTGGAIPADGRNTLRARVSDINFQKNPNGNLSGIMLTSNHIDLSFENCTMQGWQATMGKHYMAIGCTFQSGQIAGGGFEADKLSETLVLDNCTVNTFMGGATGFTYYLARNTTFSSAGVPLVQISPRQFRSLGCTFDAQSSGFPPFTFAHNGPVWYYEFKSTVFTSSTANTWTFAANSDAPLIIGTNANWDTNLPNLLKIPTSFAQFEEWLIKSYVGGIVALTANALGPVTANWGYITRVTSDGAGGALWLYIAWSVGAKPVAPASIDIAASAFRRLTIASTCSFTGSLTYANARAAKQTVAPFGTNYDFPTRMPPEFTNLPATSNACLSAIQTPLAPLPVFGAHPRTLTPTMVARIQARWNDATYATWVNRYKTGGAAASAPVGVALQYIATGSTTNLNAAVTTALATPYTLANNATNHADYYLADDATTLLDWCYAALTPTQRANLIAQLDSFCSERETNLPGNNTTGEGFNLHEGQTRGIHSYIFACIAAQGELGFNDRAIPLRNIVQNYLGFQSEVYSSGTWTDYAYQGSYWSSIPIIYGIATGQDMSSYIDWTPNRPAFIIRGLPPDLGNNLSGRGDESQSSDVGVPNYVNNQRAVCAEFYMIADYMRDTSAQWLGDKVKAAFGMEGASAQGFAVQGLTFYDNTLASITPTLATGWSGFTNYPTQAQGYTHMRSAFGFAGPGADFDIRGWVYGGGMTDHDDHPAAGHVLILRGADDLITSGFTYISAVGNYEQTWAENSLSMSTLMLTPAANSAAPDFNGSQRQPKISATKAASTAQYPISALTQYLGGTPYTVASQVLSFATDGVTDKVVLDNSQAYVPATQATNVLRTVWYVRGASSGVADTFITWDRWTPAAGGLFHPRQIWWGKTKPTTGTQTVITGSTTAGVISCAAGNIAYSRGVSKAVIQPLTTLTLRQIIGGVGFENWLDGAQIAFQTQAETGLSTADYNARLGRCLGQWRTELTIADAGTEIITAISIGASAFTAPVLTVTAGTPRTIAVGSVTIQLN